MGPLGGRDSSITDLAFKEHAARARRRTRVRTASSTPPVAGREGQGEFSRNARPAPKVMGTTVSARIQATPSRGWASLGPRPLKEQGWGKANRPKEPGKKLKSCLLNTYYVPGLGRGSAGLLCPGTHPGRRNRGGSRRESS